MTNRISQRLSEDAALIEAALDRYLSDCDSRYSELFEAMRYSALGPGKRIRPVLTLEFCRMYGGLDEAALPFACAIELIHNYSLIHDDLPCMDNDDYRRGRLTNHKKFGEAYALLAGDALLTYAFEVAADNTYVDSASALEAVALLAKASGSFGMIGGQMLDLIGEKTKHELDTLKYMHSMKTGALITAACELGCLAAGYADRERARRYGAAVGLAFQIEDDILDMEEAGKEEDKTTFMTYYTKEAAAEYSIKLTDEACEAISSEKSNEFLTGLARLLQERRK